MPLGLIGVRVGMTQVYDDAGKVTPVTVLQLGPCPVLQVKTDANVPGRKSDGYFAVQVGYEDKPRRKASRAERGHVSNELVSKRKAKRAAAGEVPPPKADCEPQRYVREFRLDAAPAVNVGEKLDVQKVFGDIKAVDVIGTSKGRGFTGVIKRHNFGGMPAAHGAKKVHRQAGSTGAHATNRGSGRPKKGIRRAGQYGNTRTTVRNLTVVAVDLEKNVLLVKGAVPGYDGSFVMVRPTNHVPVPKPPQENPGGKKK